MAAPKKTSLKEPDKVIDKKLKSVGNKLKKLRKEAGFTNYENFAFEYDFNRVSYGRIETGVNITLKSLIRVLEIHKITLNEFFKDIE
jgi:transcriptional regulator with XRE-family HTH domain